MIVSMTGFGNAACQKEQVHYDLEIRSLNNRYYKSVIRLPETVAGMEPELDNLLRRQLGRGTILYILNMRFPQPTGAWKLNGAILEDYLKQIQSLPGVAGKVNLDLGALLQLPGVVREPDDWTDKIEAYGPTIRQLTQEALGKLLQMRRSEGEGLYKDLSGHLGIIRSNLEAIKARGPMVLGEWVARLTARIQELLAGNQIQVSQADLVKEVAVFAERSDIAEEVQRLSAHLDAFEQSCQHGEHVGRKLDFIAQEMLREANTIGSKSNDSQIATRIVDVKGAIDRIKEQVQNVE